MNSTIVWLRNDLRIEDNPAIAAAGDQGSKVYLIYIYHEGASGDLSIGGASKWWLHHALNDLMERTGGSLLILKSENLAKELLTYSKKLNASAVYWNRRYEPEAIEIDSQVKEQLKKDGIEAKSFVGNILNEPHKIKNKSGKPFQVFTPYWKTCKELEVDKVCLSSKVSISRLEGGIKLEQLKLLPSIPWDKEFFECWDPSRKGAEQRLLDMKRGKANDYTLKRDIPSLDGTSCLSSWLHFGQISSREVFHALSELGSEVHFGYIRQLYWRDFAYHLMFHFPYSVRQSLKTQYDLFPWEPNGELVEKWQKGETGYPIVDAGMRQLWQTGWMHNRVRMIVASFLVKHLLQDWREGLAWFWDTLADADLANNVMGWQWCAGSGADAAPYFRIFNPVSQGEKFDPDGDYVRKYIPELACLPKKFIHKPWELTSMELKSYGITLGETYASPIVELKAGRQKALDAFQKFKQLKELR